MRARAALADALHRAGRIESASAEVEAMLELNTGDNQGLRYRLERPSHREEVALLAESEEEVIAMSSFSAYAKNF